MHTTSYHAYAPVKEVILSGRLRGGALLSESEIAECIRTRPAPAREAFLRIEAEGSMRLDPKRGARVLLPIDNNEARQMLGARLLVETHCARISMGSPALSEMVGQLQANLVAQSACGSREAGRLHRTRCQIPPAHRHYRAATSYSTASAPACESSSDG